MTFQPMHERKPAVTLAGTKPTTPVRRHAPSRKKAAPTRVVAITHPTSTVGRTASISASVAHMCCAPPLPLPLLPLPLLLPVSIRPETLPLPSA